MPTLFTGNPLAVAHVSGDAVRELLGEHPAPCLSLYMPTHRKVPENLVDRPAFRHLVEALETGLSHAHPRPEIDRLLEPLHTLGENVRFWQHARDGLAVLAADGTARVFQLPVQPRPLALVTGRFHTLPLLRLVAGADRYNVLALSSRAAHVFEGCLREGAADTLDPVPLHGLGEPAALDRGEAVDAETWQPHRVQRGMGPTGLGGGSIVHGGTGSKRDDVDADTAIFLRYVDEVVHERVSRHSGLPLVLVALPRLAAAFRGLSRNRSLLDEGVSHDVHLVPEERLPALVAPVFARARERLMAHEVRLFTAAHDRGLAADDLSDIARAAVAGKVSLLLVEKDRFEPGRFDRDSGAIERDGVQPADLSRTGDAPAVRTEDLLGAIAESVVLHGGGILALDRIRMPTESGAAAIYRYP
ncbi:MAG: hypothetical protein EBZ74_02040 [Planctomycetia bacterium]|nr:hypothetical protein [Planctomycetia bacterium]